MKTKQDIRKYFLNLRNRNNFNNLDEQIIYSLHNNILYTSSQTVMLFYPLKKEINVLPLLKDDKTFCFPKIIDNEIYPFYAGKKYVEGKFNILEPYNTSKTDIADIDVVIAPAICVDLKGNRLGYGKGFYDRFIKTLNKSKTKIISLVYDEFVVDSIFANSFDEKIDIVVTEKRTICF